jgi:hypothetical protein
MLGLIDRLARGWLRWRVSRAMKDDPDFNKDKCAKAIQQGKDFVINHPVAAAIARAGYELLEACGAKNYVEFKVLYSDIYPPRKMVVTFAWADGENPAARAARLQVEIDNQATIAGLTVQDLELLADLCASIGSGKQFISIDNSRTSMLHGLSLRLRRLARCAVERSNPLLYRRFGWGKSGSYVE